MVIQMIITNDLGVFHSEKMEMTREQYIEMVKISKGFYKEEFEIWTEDGFIVFPPYVIERSILKISIIEDGDTK